MRTQVANFPGVWGWPKGLRRSFPGKKSVIGWRSRVTWGQCPFPSLGSASEPLCKLRPTPPSFSSSGLFGPSHPRSPRTGFVGSPGVRCNNNEKLILPQKEVIMFSVQTNKIVLICPVWSFFFFNFCWVLDLSWYQLRTRISLSAWFTNTPVRQLYLHLTHHHFNYIYTRIPLN